MDTLFSLKVFRQVVQSGSFTRAAGRLGISVPMASKHVAALEQAVGAQLLYRNRRSVKPTEQGEQYFRRCQTALDILDQAQAEAASGSLKAPRGILRVSAPQWFACEKFARWMTEYGRRYPEVELVLTLDNRYIDLNGEGEDVALRLTEQPLPDTLIARPLGRVPFYLAAAPAYLAAHGSPVQAADLSAHRAVMPSYVDVSEISAQHQGRTEKLTLNGRIRSSTTAMSAQLIKSGAGLGYLPSWLCADDIRSGALVRLLPQHRLMQPVLYALYADRRHMNAKLRSFIDFLAQCCRDDADTLPVQAA